jgi:2-(1,2-epoxy-1,2-dihydrophenyl)acetyl-CoA isomerase
MLTRRVLGASEALDWNLVTRVVPDEDLQGESLKLAAQLAAGPTRAFGNVKRLLLQSAGDHLESQMEQEARCIADAARGADGKEGIAAFLDKRPPRFVGN